jgi:predicted nucleic acid-binding protein
MIAVSNTTPLRYLIAIDQEYLLPQLFEKIFIPVAVFEELTDSRTPDKVRHSLLARPTWLEVRAVPEAGASPFPLILHRGERESILLAEALQADILLVDEHAGRTLALRRNLPLSGTLGVLERADNRGLLSDFSQTLKQLKASGFYITDALEEQLLQRHVARRRLK